MAALEAPDGPLKGNGMLAVQVLTWTMRPRAFLSAGRNALMTDKAPNTFDVEFTPDRVERKNLDRSWGQNTGIVDQNIEAESPRASDTP